MAPPIIFRCLFLVNLVKCFTPSRSFFKKNKSTSSPIHKTLGLESLNLVVAWVSPSILQPSLANHPEKSSNAPKDCRVANLLQYLVGGVCLTNLSFSSKNAPKMELVIVNCGGVQEKVKSSISGVGMVVNLQIPFRICKTQLLSNEELTQHSCQTISSICGSKKT